MMNFEGMLKSYSLFIKKKESQRKNSQKTGAVKEYHNLSRKQIKMLCGFAQMLQYLIIQVGLNSVAVHTHLTSQRFVHHQSRSAQALGPEGGCLPHGDLGIQAADVSLLRPLEHMGFRSLKQENNVVEGQTAMLAHRRH